MQIEKDHVGRVDEGGVAMGGQNLVEIATLRDGAGLALRADSPFRRVPSLYPAGVTLASMLLGPSDRQRSGLHARER